MLRSGDVLDEDENLPTKDVNYETTPASAYPPRIDLQRFQKLIEQEDLSTIASESTAAEVDNKGRVPETFPTKVAIEAHATQTESTADPTAHDSE